MTYYLTHYLMQTCGLVKISEIEVANPAAAALEIDSIVARHPNDSTAFSLRKGGAA